MITAFLKRNFFPLGLTLLYGAAVIFLLFFHEVWRDEVRALNYATEAKSLLDLFVNLRNESHPALWHVLLYLGYNIFHSKIVLQVLNVVFSISAVFLFLKYSPFSSFLNTLFVFGYFPLYGFGVISRSYSLLMLLAILAAIFYEKRFERIFVMSFVLFLLANTHVLGTIFAFAIFLGMLAEFLYGIFTKNPRVHWLKFFLFSLIVILGITSAGLVAFPDSKNITSQVFPRTIEAVFQGSILSIIFPGSSVSDGFGVMAPVFVSAVLWIFYFYLFFNNPALFLTAYINFFLIELLFQVYYRAFPWHAGVAMIFFVVIFWMKKKSEKNYWVSSTHRYREKIQFLTGYAKNFLEYFIVFLFLMQVSLAAPLIYQDITREFSSAKKIAQDLRKEKRLETAILLGEPDEYVETLAYYLNNDIYILREKRFGKTTRWSTDIKSILSMKEMLEEIENLYQKYKKTVIIFLQLDEKRIYDPEKDWKNARGFGNLPPYVETGDNDIYVREISFGRIFMFDRQSLEEFYSKTRFFGDYRGSLGARGPMWKEGWKEVPEDFTVYIYPKMVLE